MRKKRQFTRHEESTHAAGVAPIDQPEKWDVQLERGSNAVAAKLLSLLNRIARNPNFVPTPEPESTRRNATAGRKRKAA